MTVTEPAPADLDAQLLPRPWRITEVIQELGTTVTLMLVPADGGGAPDFRPGQISMLAVPGVGEVPISISTAPREGLPWGHTIRAAGAVTTALCALAVGDVVGLRGPFGVDWDPGSARGRDVVVVAGGIGLAPLRSLVREVVADRDAFGRVVLCIGARTPADVLYAAEIEEWGRLDGVDVVVTVDLGDDDWTGPVGLVTAPLHDLDVDWSTTTAFVCGPDVMMRAVAGTLHGLGMAPPDIRLTLERNMKCGVGLCGHCQLGPVLVCVDGPVVTYDRLEPFYGVREI